jgi:hypothetical protein
MHFTNNFTSFTCSVNSFSVNFQDRLGVFAALRDAKSGFRKWQLLEINARFLYVITAE